MIPYLGSKYLGVIGATVYPLVGFSLKRALVIAHLEVEETQITLMKEVPLALLIIISAWSLLESTLRSLRSVKSKSIFFLSGRELHVQSFLKILKVLSLVSKMWASIKGSVYLWFSTYYILSSS